MIKTYMKMGGGLLGGMTAAGYALYRYVIIRRKERELPEPGTGKNEVRKYYSTNLHENLQWMKSWGWQDVTIRNRSGRKLCGYFFSAGRQTKRTVLAVHGYRNNAFREYAFQARFFLKELGVNLLLVDDCAHGTSEGERIGFSWNDRLDCIDWADWIVKTLGEDSEIVLHGISMGAATVLNAAGEEELPEQVKGVMEDCGFSSLRSEIRHVMKYQFHVFPFPLYELASTCNRTLNGFFFGKADVESQTARIKIPVLFLHGDRDRYVPTWMVYRLYNACNSRKRLCILRGAAHAEGFLADQVRYKRNVRKFMKEIWNDQRSNF